MGSVGDRVPDAGRARVVGVDVARFVAIFWMFVAHIGPDRDADGLNRVLWIGDGREAALFAFLAGLSLTMVYRGRRDGAEEAPPRWRDMAGKTAVRAVFLLALGVAFASVDTGVLVILPFFAAYFVCALPGLFLGTRLLVVLAVYWALIGPLVSFFVRNSWEQNTPGIRVPEVSTLSDPGEMLSTLFVTGTYPVLTWMPFVLAGMAVGRLDLGDLGVQRALLAVGSAVALLGYGGSLLLRKAFGGDEAIQRAADEWFTLQPGQEGPVLGMLKWFVGSVPANDPAWLLTAQGHSGTPFEVVGATGVACAVLGMCLLVCRSVRAVGWVAAPAAVGAMSLSVYSLHLVAGWSPLTPGAGSWTRLFAYTAVALAGAWAWRRYVARKGPLEWVLAYATTTRPSARPVTPEARAESP